MALTARLDAGRQLALAAIGRLWPQKIGHAQRFMINHLRANAMRRWRPRALGIPVFYVSCEQTPRWVEAQWQALCHELRGPLCLPGGHHDVFSEAALAKLTPAFELAVRSALVPV